MARMARQKAEFRARKWVLWSALLVSGALTACGGGGHSPVASSGVAPSNPAPPTAAGVVDPELVGTWVGPEDVSQGSNHAAGTMTMILSGVGTMSVDGDARNLHPAHGTWGVSEGRFNAKGADGFGTVVDFNAPRSTTRLVGTISTNTGATGTFVITKQ